ALIDMVRRLHIVIPTTNKNKPVKITKPFLCDLIKKSSVLPNVNVKAGNKVVTGSNATLRLGSRMCSTYKRDTLARFARALGGSVLTDMDKPAICKLIQQLSMAKRARLQTNFNRQKEANSEAAKKVEENRKKSIENKKRANKEKLKSNKQAEKNVLLAEKQEEINEERVKIKKARNIKARLTRNLVKADILKMSKKNTVNNTNVNRLMNTIDRAIQNGTIKKSKTGFPLKTSVEKVKRSFISSLKDPPPKKPSPKRWANYSNNESPSPLKKKPNSNSNENFNYFMKGPKA
ncbi:MAG: hypothetical protein WCQ44_12735, partial [Opitutaceae bacterium]